MKLKLIHTISKLFGQAPPRPATWLVALFVVALVMQGTGVLAATFYSRASGSWNAASTWSTVGCGGTAASTTPGSTDNIIICSGHTVTIQANTTYRCGDITIFGTLQLDQAGVLEVQGGGTTPVTTGAVSGNGTIRGSTGGTTALKQYGNWSFNGTITNRFYVVFYGSQDATMSAIPSSGQFRTIWLSKASGATQYFNVTPTYNTTEGFVRIETFGNYCYNGAGQTVLLPNGPNGIDFYTNLTLAGSGVKTTTGIEVRGILSMEGTATLSTALTYGTDATLRYNTATPRTVGAEWSATFTPSGGVIIENTGTITLNGAKNISNNLSIAAGSVANLATFTHTAGTLTLGGAGTPAGSWGSTSSAATYKNDTYFAATTGIINVGNSSCIPPTVTYTKTDITCFDAGDGTITITASGGSGPYQYSKDGGATWQSSNVFNNLTPGDYILQVRDSNGCVQINCE